MKAGEDYYNGLLTNEEKGEIGGKRDKREQLEKTRVSQN